MTENARRNIDLPITYDSLLQLIHGSGLNYVQLVQDIDAMAADWGTTLQLADYFDRARLLYERELGSMPEGLES